MLRLGSAGIRRRAAHVALAIVGSLSTTTAGKAQSEGPGLTAERVAEVRRLADHYGSELGFSGAVLVSWGDSVVLRAAYGLANAELGTPNTPDTPFRLASLSKQFTAAAILVLEQDDLVDLSVPISEYLPELNPAIGDRVTLHHLLSHSSGIVRDIESLTDEDLASTYVPVSRIVDLVGASDLLFEPGSTWSYSNPGYGLAAAVIESVTGQPYRQAMRALVFEPAGLRHTGHEAAHDVLPGRADGYVRLPNGLVNAAYEDKSYVIGAGSIYSTVDDLHAWSRELLHGDLLTPESRDMLFTRQAGRSSYGWWIDTYVWPPDVGSEEGLSVHFDGGSPGFMSNVSLYVDHDLVAIILSNVLPTRANGLYNQAANILLGFDEPLPEPRDEATYYEVLFSEGLPGVDSLRAAWEAADESYRLPREGELYQVGRGYLDARRYPEAMTVFDVLIEANPRWPYLLFKGIAAAESGDEELARTLFEATLEAEPGQPNAQAWLRRVSGE